MPFGCIFFIYILLVQCDLLTLPKSPELKPCIKLPKTDTHWKAADIFFRSELHSGDINDYNLTETVERMNNVIYNYFAEKYGTVKNKNYDKGLHDNIKILININ